MSEERDPFSQWCLVEVMGHRTVVGHVTEQTIAGAGFIRVDVPDERMAEGFVTHFYNPASIYGMRPLAEQLARGIAGNYHKAAVGRYDLPQEWRVLIQEWEDRERARWRAEQEPLVVDEDAFMRRNTEERARTWTDDDGSEQPYDDPAWDDDADDELDDAKVEDGNPGVRHDDDPDS